MSSKQRQPDLPAAAAVTALLAAATYDKKARIVDVADDMLDQHYRDRLPRERAAVRASLRSAALDSDAIVLSAFVAIVALLAAPLIGLLLQGAQLLVTTAVDNPGWPWYLGAFGVVAVATIAVVKLTLSPIELSTHARRKRMGLVELLDAEEQAAKDTSHAELLGAIGSLQKAIHTNGVSAPGAANPGRAEASTGVGCRWPMRHWRSRQP